MFSLNMDWRPAYDAALAARPGFSGRAAWFFYCFLLACACFFLSFAVRALEVPLWDNTAYVYEGERLLATQDAYHWVAGAEGFEFGAGHPMSEALRILASLTGKPLVNVGFWLPLIMGSLLAVGVFLWGAALGHPHAGVVAGCLASLAPGFWARTMLGYCDTDVILLLFATLLGFVPMCWLQPWLCGFRRNQPLPRAAGLLWKHLWVFCTYCWSREAQCAFWREFPPLWQQASLSAPRLVFRSFRNSCLFLWARMRAACASSFYEISRQWKYTLVLSPVPLIQARCLTFFWLTLLVLAGTWGHWTQDWHSYFRYGVRFTALFVPVLIFVFGPYGGRRHLMAGGLCFCIPLLGDLPGTLMGFALAIWLAVLSGYARRGHFPLPFMKNWARHVPAAVQWTYSHWVLAAFWVLVLVMLMDIEVWSALIRSIFAYVKSSGDVADGAAGGADPLVYPAVAQSISEVRNISILELFANFHPYLWLSMLAVIGYVALLVIFPGIAVLSPLVLIAFSSMALGERMAMFGAPVLSLGVCVFFGHAVKLLLHQGKSSFGLTGALRNMLGYQKTFSLIRFFAATGIAVVLVLPMTRQVADMSRGPVISREHVEALRFIRAATPEDAVVWNWWDWGYATHYFARRKTVCDGARHGGPSLYVPAAVYATDDPHFARQLMAYTSEKGGDPGDVFQNLTAAGASELLADIASGKLAPVAKKNQYIVISAEHIPLGFWITEYGTWDFRNKKGNGYAISSVPSALQYNFTTGTVLIRGVPKRTNASSIAVFSNSTMKRQSYANGESNQHLIVNESANERFIIDDRMYAAMLHQLLIAPRDDPELGPYFTLVFDNGMARVYEMRQ